MALEFACFDVVLAFAALFGLAAFFTLRCRVHSALSPLVSLCSVSLVLAAAGLLFNWLDREGSLWSAWLVHMGANLAINTIGLRLFGII